MRQRRKSNWIELNAVANAIGWCSVQALWIAIVIVCFANVAQADIIDDSMASATVSGSNLVSDHVLTVQPNYDATDESFVGTQFFTDEATLWNWQVTDADGSFVGSSNLEFVEVTLTPDSGTWLDGEIRYGLASSSYQTTLTLLGGATFDGVPAQGNWTLNAPNELSITGQSLFTTAFGNLQNPTWTGEATGIVWETRNFTVFGSGGYGGIGIDATIVSVPEPSPIPFLVGAALIYWGRRKRG